MEGRGADHRGHAPRALPARRGPRPRAAPTIRPAWTTRTCGACATAASATRRGCSRSREVVRIVVADTGARASRRSTSTSIFDPFFTTKAPGRGHGAGPRDRGGHRGGAGRPHRGLLRPGRRRHLPPLPPASARDDRDERSRDSGGRRRGRAAAHAPADPRRRGLRRAHRRRRRGGAAGGRWPSRRELILCDIRMPRLDGLGFVERYRAAGGEALVVMMSAYGTLETAVEAMRRGAYDYISKPFNADEVLLAMRKAEEREALRREVRRLRAPRAASAEGFEKVIGRSPALPRGARPRRARRAVSHHRAHHRRERHGQGGRRARDPPRLAARRAGLRGGELRRHPREPAGERALRPREGRLHRRRARPRGPLRRGRRRHPLPRRDRRAARPAPGEAAARAPGADGPPRRAARRSARVDVRVLAATTRDLVEEVAEGPLPRGPLLPRSTSSTSTCPRCARAPRTSPLLADHFLARHAERLGHPERRAPRARAASRSSPATPGRATCASWRTCWSERSSSRAATLDEEHLPAHVRSATPPFAVPVDDDDLSVKRRLPALERELIARALERTRGNRTRAAELLELSTRALSYKIQEYGLD